MFLGNETIQVLLIKVIDALKHNLELLTNEREKDRIGWS
tara:strand:- start:2426 stop:2542 length:117 start_codon:yes stop_codon:yes gene_type:complete